MAGRRRVSRGVSRFVAAPRLAGAITLTIGLSLLALAGFAAQAGQWSGTGPMRGPAALGRLGALDPGQVPRGDVGDAASALKAYPLAAEPFLVLALAAPDEAMRTARLREALQRDPHSLATHLAVMSQAAQRRDTAELGRQLAAIARLDGAVADDLLRRLANGADDAERARDLAHIVGNAPDLATKTLAGMGARVDARDRGEAILSAFVDVLPAPTLRDTAFRVRAAQEFARVGNFSKARRLWPGPPSENPIFGGDFRDLSAPPPFSWQLVASSAGAAEGAAGGGLALSAYGHGSGVLADQLLTLGPGRWKFALDYEPRSASGGALILRLRCAIGGVILAQRRLDGTRGAQHLELVGAVPGDCGGQRLELSAEPEEANQPQQVLVHRITAERQGA